LSKNKKTDREDGIDITYIKEGSKKAPNPPETFHCFTNLKLANGSDFSNPTSTEGQPMQAING